MAVESSSMHADLYEIILVERNIEDLTVWARVVALPSFLIAATFVLAAWIGLFSGSVASTLPGCFGAALLGASLYLPRITMWFFQSLLSKAGKRAPHWSLNFIWSVIGISLWLAMTFGIWSVNYPGLLLPLVFGLSPGQSLESFHEQTKHNEGILLQLLKFPLGNGATILNMFGVFSAVMPHLFISSLSLPPVMAIAITLVFLMYTGACAIFAVRQSFPELMPFCPHIIYMFFVAAFVHVRHFVARIGSAQWTLSTSQFHFLSSLHVLFSAPVYRFILRIAIALFSSCVFWVMGSKGIRFFVDAVFIIGYSTIIFKFVLTTQGFVVPPNVSSHSTSPLPRTGGYSLRRPIISNILTLFSCIAISLPVQFLPLDWMPFGRHILIAIGDDVPPESGLLLTAFVVWSVLGPMLLLRDLRLSMLTLVFIYGGNLIYVDISVFFALRTIANSTPHPPFVLNDVILESVSVSICLLLLLTVSHLTMQVIVLSSTCCLYFACKLIRCFLSQRRFKIDDRLAQSARGVAWLAELKVKSCILADNLLTDAPAAAARLHSLIFIRSRRPSLGECFAFTSACSLHHFGSRNLCSLML